MFNQLLKKLKCAKISENSKLLDRLNDQVSPKLSLILIVNKNKLCSPK